MVGGSSPSFALVSECPAASLESLPGTMSRANGLVLRSDLKGLKELLSEPMLGEAALSSALDACAPDGEANRATLKALTAWREEVVFFVEKNAFFDPMKGVDRDDIDDLLSCTRRLERSLAAVVPR